MAKVQEIGPYSAYAIAKKYGYQGTEEEWISEQEANRKAAEAAASAAAESAKQAAASAEQAAGAAANVDNAKNSAVEAVKNEGTAQQSAVAATGTSAVQNVKDQEAQSTRAVQSAGTTQISQVNSAGAAQVKAVKDEGAAQTSALDNVAAAHKTELEGIASHPPRPNTETGKWQVWNAESGEYQDTDALYQGGYYTPSVSEDGTLTWQGSQEGMPELPSSNIKGAKGPAGLGVPPPTSSDAGKVPVVNADGTGYELGDAPVDSYTKAESDARYAPISAAIRPTANGNPVNITDSVEWPLQGLTVYGKSTQDGKPSLENPVPIVSAGDGGSIVLTVSDGADRSQSLTLSTPNGLPGIPVDSGGNYTDASEQQWVCDEVDFARGVYVQRCATEKITGTPAFNTTSDVPNRYWWIGALVNRFRNGSFMALSSFAPWASWANNPKGGPIAFALTSTAIYFYKADTTEEGVNELFTALIAGSNCIVVGQLANPVETELSPEELAAYRALYTYDGATVVSTPEDVAGIEVRYLADGEKYIDRKISEAIASAAETKLAAYDTLSGAIHEGVNEA